MRRVFGVNIASLCSTECHQLLTQKPKLFGEVFWTCKAKPELFGEMFGSARPNQSSLEGCFGPAKPNQGSVEGCVGPARLSLLLTRG